MFDYQYFGIFFFMWRVIFKNSDVIAKIFFGIFSAKIIIKNPERAVKIFLCPNKNCFET